MLKISKFATRHVNVLKWWFGIKLCCCNSEYPYLVLTFWDPFFKTNINDASR